MSTVLLAIAFTVSLTLVGLPGWMNVTIILVVIGVLVYLWSLPEPPTRQGRPAPVRDDCPE